MKRRMLGLLTALALCLALLPGVALAEGDGVVTITDVNGGNAVVLELGKYYTPKASGDDGGVAEWTGEAAPTGPYLYMSPDGTLIVGKNYAETVGINGSMSIGADLTMKGGVLQLSSNTTSLSLNGHTLTLKGEAPTLVLNTTPSPDSSPAALDGGGGTIRCEGDNSFISSIDIQNQNGLAASDLTLEGSYAAYIYGSAVEGLTFKNGGAVSMYPKDSEGLAPWQRASPAISPSNSSTTQAQQPTSSCPAATPSGPTAGRFFLPAIIT